MRFEFDDIRAYLGGAEPYEPPPVDDKLRDLNLIMAAAVAVRVYDEMRRKAPIPVSDAIKDAADAVERLDSDACEEACLGILRALSKCEPKAMPLDMKTASLLAMALVDAGVIRPPMGYSKEELDKAVQLARMILMSMAGRMSEIEEKRLRDEKAPGN